MRNEFGGIEDYCPEEDDHFVDPEERMGVAISRQ